MTIEYRKEHKERKGAKPLPSNPILCFAILVFFVVNFFPA